MAHLAPCLWHITKTYLLHLQALIHRPSRALLYWDQNGRKGATPLKTPEFCQFLPDPRPREAIFVTDFLSGSGGGSLPIH